MSSTVVTFDKTTIKAKLNVQSGKARMILAQQVLKDSNFFAPMDSGDLIKSGVTSSIGDEITWNTPYARAQYHGLPNKSTDMNPNASMKWFEVAKAKWAKSWANLFKRGLNA